LEGSYDIFMNQKKWMIIKSTITASINSPYCNFLIQYYGKKLHWENNSPLSQHTSPEYIYKTDNESLMCLGSDNSHILPLKKM
jgi:hypothetical protein